MVVEGRGLQDGREWTGLARWSCVLWYKLAEARLRLQPMCGWFGKARLLLQLPVTPPLRRKSMQHATVMPEQRLPMNVSMLAVVRMNRNLATIRRTYGKTKSARHAQSRYWLHTCSRIQGIGLPSGTFDWSDSSVATGSRHTLRPSICWLH